MSPRRKKPGCLGCGSDRVPSGTYCPKCDPDKKRLRILKTYAKAFEGAFVASLSDYIGSGCTFNLGKFSIDMGLGGRLKKKVVEDYGEEAWKVLYNLNQVSMDKSKLKYGERGSL